MKVSDIYANQEFFELEKSNIYEKYWIYFCQFSFLQKTADTFSRDVCSNPVSVRNTGKELIAFENICAHRRATIFFEESSNRPFVCKYHGWVYDEEAKLSRIPNSQVYEFAQQEVEACGKLKRYAVKVLGSMVFVNLSPNPIAIEEQFHADFLSQLEDSSSHFDDAVISTSWEAHYNWKLNFENVMDWNHVRFVHPSSFAPLQVKNQADIDSSQEWKTANRQEKQEQSFGEIDVRDLSYATQSDVNLPDRWFRNHIERYKDRDRYYNWYIFPNVNYCSIGGDHFLIQQFDPIDALSNNYRLEIVTAKRKELVNFSPLLKALIEGEKRVINEDIIFLESQQINLKKSGSTDYFQGVNEAPLRRFRKWTIDNVYKK
jgi:phenylpropionate dioxygenase-like ring-hydroxylating dioxygenase large terminal subunit